MNVLAFFAHPDDETMLAGGTLALAARQGARVHYVCATRGEGGELGEPPRCARPDLGRVREHELACAVAWLFGHSLTFLDYIDPLVGADNTLHPYADSVDEVAGRLAALARDKHADVIVTHGTDGEYGHPAHVLSNRAACRALELLKADGRAPLLYTVQASFPDHPKPFLANASDEAHLVLNTRPAANEKLRAALCHVTQHALFVRRDSQEAGRRLGVHEVLAHLESLRRADPPLPNGPDGLYENAPNPVPEDAFARLFFPYRLLQPEL